MADRAAVVGSGAGGSVAAMVLAEAGWDVVVLERGSNPFGDLTRPAPGSSLANDELKGPIRGFEYPDPLSEPRTFRAGAEVERPFVGFVDALPSIVGGGTVHWDAKTPRFWDIDFMKRSLLGPMPEADVVDWPFDYDELAPFYDTVEALLGVQGDVTALPERPTLVHAPRIRPLALPPGPPQYSSLVAARGAERLGLHPFPAPTAINSVLFDERPACTNCGFCCGYGCPIHARGDALVFLRRALRAGAELVTEASAVRVELRGRRAVGVMYRNVDGELSEQAADLVVLAASSVETVRLALLSRLPDPHDLVGRYSMFHWHTAAYGVFAGERLHPGRGRASSHALDDFADPHFSAAPAQAKAVRLPYVRGGTVELGASPLGPIAEGLAYRALLRKLSPSKPFGRTFKQLMRESPLRDRLLGVQMHGEDVPQRENRVDLDPAVVDWRGVPVARITYRPHRHELAAQQLYLPLLVQILREAGADVADGTAETRSELFPTAPSLTPRNFHTLGGMRMGEDPRSSVTDPVGRVHSLDNVVVADGSVFPSSGGHNPTLTIMATALRNATTWA